MSADVPATHLCLSTLFADPMRIGADDLREAIDAAATAGFAGVSLWTLHHMLVTADGMDPSELRDRLGARGLTCPVVEAMPGWANARDEDAVRADAGFAIGVADDVGASCAVAVCLEPELADRDRTVRHLQLVGDLAADAGLDVAVEFLPWTAIDSFRTCAQLLEDCDRSNVGMLLDVWHWHRQDGGPDPAALAATSGDRIKLVQLSDATPTPGADLYAEAVSDRLVPGAGVIDLDTVLDGLVTIGAAPLFSPEVFSDAGRAAGMTAWATSIRQACDDVLGRSDRA